MNKEKPATSHGGSQIPVEFTDRPITALGGMAATLSRYLEKPGFRQWVESSLPVAEMSNNAKGVYPKVLATMLTALTGGERFSHIGWWDYGKEVMLKCFGVDWLPGCPSVLTRFWNKFSFRSVAEKTGDELRSLAARMVREWEGIH